LTIERILVFIRNVLQIPSCDDKKTDKDATVHDEVKYQYHYDFNNIMFSSIASASSVFSNNIIFFLLTDIICI